MKKIILGCFLGSLSVLLTAQPTCQSPLGATLAPVYWNFNPSNWFVDYMKMANPDLGPVSGPWDPGGPALNADGWPVEPFSIWVKLGLYPHDAGNYTLQFEGYAAVSAFGEHAITDVVYDAPTNTTTAKLAVNPSAPQLALQFNAPMSAVVKNIRLIAPGFDPAAHPTFHPDWTDHLTRFQVLRFMNWTQANYDTTAQWAYRTKPSSLSQNKGLAWEYVAEMANLTGSDIWINVPVNATDDYVVQLATLLQSTLQVDAKIYIEYANEVWNGNAYPHNANKNAAIAEVSAGGSLLNYDGAMDPEIWASRRFARRTKEIGDLFAGVFGANQLFSRIFPVLGYQAVNPQSYLRYGLEFVSSQYGPPKDYFWAIAGAPFLSINNALFDGMSRDDYFQLMHQELDNMFNETDNYLDEGVSFAAFYGMQFMAHEAGTSTEINATYPQALRDTLAIAQTDPRMKTLVEGYLENWFRYGGEKGIFNWFVAGATDYSRGDTYGLTSSISELHTVKIQAIDQVLANECPNQDIGHPVPGVVDARQFVRYPDTWDQQPYNQVVFEGNSHQYLLRATATGNYCFGMVVEAADFGVAKFQIILDDTIVGVLTAPYNQNPGTDTIFLGNILFTEGIHTLKVKYLTWCYGTHALWIEPDICQTGTLELVATPLVISPNPTPGGFTIAVPEGLSGEQTLRISDLTGKVQFEKPVNLGSEHNISVEWAPSPGFYAVRLGNYLGKLAVQK